MKGFCCTYVTLLPYWSNERYFRRLDIYILIWYSNSQCWNIVNRIRRKRISMTFVSSVQYQLTLPAHWVLITTRPGLCNRCSNRCSKCTTSKLFEELDVYGWFFHGCVGGYAKYKHDWLSGLITIIRLARTAWLMVTEVTVYVIL